MSAHQQVEPRHLGVTSWVGQSSATVANVKQDRRPKLGMFFAPTCEDRSIASSRLFGRFLSMERKRAERSGTSFMLVVLDLKSTLETSAIRKLVAPIERGIFSAVRHTDFVGWYEETENALGIVFTEIVEPNPVIASAILDRVKNALSENISPKLAMNIDYTCHVFTRGEIKNASGDERCALASD